MRISLGVGAAPTCALAASRVGVDTPSLGVLPGSWPLCFCSTGVAGLPLVLEAQLDSAGRVALGPGVTCSLPPEASVSVVLQRAGSSLLVTLCVPSVAWNSHRTLEFGELRGRGPDLWKSMALGLSMGSGSSGLAGRRPLLPAGGSRYTQDTPCRRRPDGFTPDRCLSAC